ncbi:BREX-2 system adenine-specific DNA-methyltransferase PglX [Streptomyces sp. NPDC102441]|uniref:BREX-2 system adenine-specific DNA-methyltransferase PglX n=1 Tax=Streptomyces sp. NPDC102441 TaxID=3366176 RepID=UPI0037FE73D0
MEVDLQSQLGRLPDVDQRLRLEHENAVKAGRTTAAPTEWVGDRVNQAAVAWVLGTVFVRFCEDNGLLRDPFIAGSAVPRQTHAEERHSQFIKDNPAHTDRHWLSAAFLQIASTQVGKLLFDERHNPLFQIPLSNEGARQLITFWRSHEEMEGDVTGIIHNFFDPEWDTRFLGDIYQDLSVEAKEKYALLQTPEFVEDFILSRTLHKAIQEFGYDKVKMIDPTCGSGHFILGAFHRILAAWEKMAPSVSQHDRVEAALNSVHGVDINPFASAIARFRLLVAALKAAKVHRFDDARSYDWPIHIATGDALLKFEQGKLFDSVSDEGGLDGYEFHFTTEDISRHLNILTPGRYHVVVGNPPYIVPGKDSPKALYRKLYKTCYKQYQLTAPFAERFFELAKPAEGDSQPGYVGQITGNGFMKREFGEKLIQEFLATEVDLTEVIDTSGAYIPGHGTPTVILVGRRRKASLGASTIRSVRGINGEPSVPRDPAKGQVWSEITKLIDEPNDKPGEWVSVGNLERGKYFGSHPWILMDGGLEAVETINGEDRPKLRSRLAMNVGFASFPGHDDAFIGVPSSFARRRLENGRNLIVGEVIRDWGVKAKYRAVAPYEADGSLASYNGGSAWGRGLWGVRQVLRSTDNFKNEKSWWGWYRWIPERYRTRLALTFSADAATHNQFCLTRDDEVFKQSSPVIKLSDDSAESDYLEILGVLNSSTACFWLKQMCHNKGSTVDKKGARQSKVPFEDFYQFNSSNVQEFPLSPVCPLARATELDSLAQRISAVSPATLAADPEKPPTADTLAEAREEWHRIRARMIAVQEELDWEVYALYGLHKDLTAPEESLPAEGLELGQRAFEIDLGKRVNAGEAKTEWFRRHNSKMIDEIPAEWPEAYKDTVLRRLDAMQNSNVIGLIERPEYKRRWLTDGWDKQQSAALREWLLARMERRELWYQPDYQGVEYPRTRSIRELVEALAADSDFTDVAALYAPGKELSEIVPEVVEDQHVPFLAALRYQEPIMEKKRAVWEDVWERQRAEDVATAAADHFKAKEIRDGTPVPPKYTTKDFRKDSYGAQRGSLDVPRERFISYSRTLTPAIEVLGWGGWDHAEQATALTQAIEDRRESGNWDKPDFLPYLAGLLELLPWVRQWHPEDAGFFEEVLLAWQSEEEFGVTEAELRAWRPAAVKRTRKAAVKKAKATKVPAGTEAAEQP